ncbi:MAG: type II toxin-antitoxin system VapB family antitoxin [Deltaproteobacteria bacterium]|nr:type II toxin-antitoxin system VapB family antitoxin [Deltaproteobacteria bacterium]
MPLRLDFGEGVFVSHVWLQASGYRIQDSGKIRTGPHFHLAWSVQRRAYKDNAFLVEEALRISGSRTKRETIELAL